MILENIIKSSHYIFILLFHYYLHLGMSAPFIRRVFNSLYPRMLCARFCRNCSSGSGKDSKRCQWFFSSFYLPLVKNKILHLSFIARMLFAKYDRNWYCRSKKMSLWDVVNNDNKMMKNTSDNIKKSYILRFWWHQKGLILE